MIDMMCCVLDDALRCKKQKIKLKMIATISELIISHSEKSPGRVGATGAGRTRKDPSPTGFRQSVALLET